MSEQQEALIRSQTITMLFRNNGNKKKIKRILNKFLNCIKRD
jgi:hypothetical protein|tara:strand:- start:2006 stop:2131 length:126 start_codon:yes stop_codon:yes gene_type:complete